MVHSITYFFVYIFNIICALAGAALISGGVLVAIWHGDQPEVFENVTTLWPIICATVLGAVIVIINTFGCFGAATKSVYMIYAHPALMIIITLLAAALGAVIFVRQEFVETQTINTLSIQWNIVNNIGFVNYVQSSMQCCGLNSMLEWSPTLPTTCCSLAVLACTPAAAFTASCTSAFLSLINDSIIILGALLFTAAGVHLLGFILSLVFAAALHRTLNKVTV